MSTVDPTSGSTDVPTCPRHPQVVSYVRCTRCSRPMCPQCQRQAPVGIQCVDCVRAASRQTSPARTALGVRGAGGAPATMALIGLCVLVFLAQQVQPGIVEKFCFVPFLGNHQPWRFLTVAFLHAGVTHILFNMLALWSVGPPLERVMGTLRFAALYLISAIGGSVGYLLMATPSSTPTLASAAWFTPTVGASGAVFGLFAAELLMARNQGRDIRTLLGFLAINVIIGFTVPNIAWQSHLGGFLTGGVVAGIVWSLRGRDRARWQWPALALVLVAVLALAALKYATAPDVAGWAQYTSA